MLSLFTYLVELCPDHSETQSEGSLIGIARSSFLIIPFADSLVLQQTTQFMIQWLFTQPPLTSEPQLFCLSAKARAVVQQVQSLCK